MADYEILRLLQNENEMVKKIEEAVRVLNGSDA